MTSPLISTRGLTKTFGTGPNAFTALHGIDLDVYPGESVAIVGKSGSGKSTLMHILGLLDRPTSGTFTLNGVDTTKLTERQLNRTRNSEYGFVFQQFFLNATDTVLENITTPLAIAGVSARDRKRQGMEMLAGLGIEGKAANKANDLSGGEKQRLVIARALINNPSVIFADEPTGNLDTATGATVEQILFGLNQSRGITLVVVTHDTDLAAKCDRAITLADGRIISEQANTTHIETMNLGAAA